MIGRILRFLSWLLCRLPESWADRLGIAIGTLAYYFDGKHRRQAVENLQMVFPDWETKQAKRVAKQVFQHFGKTAARFLRAPALTAEDVRRSVRCDGLNLIREALQEGKGAILITGHFGNWERMAHYFAIEGIPLSVIARDANDAETTRIVNQARRSEGFEVYPRSKAVRRVLQDLKANRCVGILPDQNAQDLFVPFFGRPAGTVSGPAVFHLKTRAPILTTFCVENADGTYQITVRRLDLPEPTGEREEDLRAIMTRINLAIEQAVRERPEQWLWLHDRWRSARREGLL